MTIAINDIALSKLVPSKINVRRTNRGERIEELAASIAAHGLLQNLTVRAADKGRFEVIAGGRRLSALKLLAKQKQWTKDAPIPCQIVEGENLTEISLAENALQCPMHPADQYEAFAELQRQGMCAGDIAARFGVTPTVVIQRLKLGAVSPKLMDLYRDGELNLDQLSAFTITDDHDLQERVWDGLSYNRSRRAILDALSDGQVSTEDRRAIFVGTKAYVAAGGTIIRDLFDEDGGGFLHDAALLNRLASEKLKAEAETVKSEGWAWVATNLAFDYAASAGMRRLYPGFRPLSDDEQTELDQLADRYDSLADEFDEDSEELAEAADKIEADIDALRGPEVFTVEQKAVAGVFVALAADGAIRIERGFVRPEDDPLRKGNSGAKDGKDKPSDALSASLIAELTAQRTAALANELAKRPDLALIAVTHALATPVFFPHSDNASCLGIGARLARSNAGDEEGDESRALIERRARHTAWEKRMPEEAAGLWDFLTGITEAERLDLLASCASLTVDAVTRPNASVDEDRQRHAGQLADALHLDMTAYWQPTAANYFSKVAKAGILKAVREGISPEAAQAIESCKKPVMAERAEKLLADKGWLPENLRAVRAHD